ncbi:MAG: crotonase/enoyl-CoA hydratase family protein [Bacteroidota bacterium]
MNYQYFTVEINNKVAHVSFNRPDKANSLNMEMWEEMKALFGELDDSPEARVVVLSGEGKHFCAGIDLELLMSIQKFQQMPDEGRKREALMKFIKTLQDAVTAIEKCRKPVLAAIHNGCIGGGVDIVAACDMRYASQDAYFTIKEIDMGMVADLGTLQRLPKLIPYGIVAEMAYTGRKVSGEEAQKIGLVNQVFGDKDEMMTQVMAFAANIAAKSPLSIRGTKEMLLYTRDHSVTEGLHHMSLWNAAMIMSNDLTEAFKATMEKRAPQYED